MAELFSRKCTFESVPVRKIFSCKYLLHFWPKTRFQVCSLNWPEDTLSYQHVCISRRQDTAMIYFWFLAKCAHFYSSFGLENSVSFLVLRNRWFSFLFALDQGSFFSHCGKQAQLQFHPRVSPSGDDKPCWIISCGRDLPILQAFTSLRLQVPQLSVNIHKNIRKTYTYIRNLSKAKDVWVLV